MDMNADSLRIKIKEAKMDAEEKKSFGLTLS